MTIFCGVHRFAFYCDSLFSYLIGCTSVSLLFGGLVGGLFVWKNFGGGFVVAVVFGILHER